MALEESPREDLLREATALVERVELVPGGADASAPSDAVLDSAIVAGFRANGALSIFFSDDEVYHFNAASELRRAYVDGHLFKASSGELVELTRVRTAEQVELRSRKLSATEQDAFVRRMKSRLAVLTANLAADKLEAHRQVPPEVDVLARLRDWLSRHTMLAIADRPNA
jgi:hypothetical protein